MVWRFLKPGDKIKFIQTMGELLNIFCCLSQIFCPKTVVPLSIKQGSGKKCFCNTMLATQFSEIPKIITSGKLKFNLIPTTLVVTSIKIHSTYPKKNVLIVFLIGFGFIYCLRIKNNECFICIKKKETIQISY